MAERKVKRMNINVEASLHNAFKAVTAARGENLTDALVALIQGYIKEKAVQAKTGCRG